MTVGGGRQGPWADNDRHEARGFEPQRIRRGLGKPPGLRNLAMSETQSARCRIVGDQRLP